MQDKNPKGKTGQMNSLYCHKATQHITDAEKRSSEKNLKDFGDIGNACKTFSMMPSKYSVTFSKFAF